MKKALSALLAAALALSLFGCGSKTGAPNEPAVPASAGQPAAEDARQIEPEWRYELETQLASGGFTGEGNVTLATVSLEYPALTVVCDDGGGTRTPPAEMQAKADAFNSGVLSYLDEQPDAEGLGTAAQTRYNETDEAYRQYFVPYSFTMEVGETRRTDGLLEVRLFCADYLGGAHGREWYKNFHFDLETGSFVELEALSDDPGALLAALADDVTNGIYERGEEARYFDGFFNAIHSREAYNVSLGADGVNVIFDEYEIAPYASGLPEFTVPYAKLWRLLNERGRRLLDVPLEERVLGDYYEASDMWYWFEGGAPVSYDDTRYEDAELRYERFAVPGVDTMEKLRAKLLTRFSAELADRRLGGTELFREFDGVLYACPAGRGTDVTVASVDYTVELNETKDGGRILADVRRQDYDEGAEQWTLTGETDRFAFPFTLGENGAVFSEFPTVW